MPEPIKPTGDDPATDTPAAGTEDNPSLVNEPAKDPAPAAGDDAGNEDAADKGSKDADGDKDKTGAPEKYEDFALPEGIEVDEALMAEFTPLAKELNLTQEQAQKLVDLQTKSVEAFHSGQLENWQNMQNDWREASRNDQEFGGLSLEVSLGKAKLALDHFGTPELKEALDVTGVGNHPEIVRLLVKVGKALSEDTLRQGKEPSEPRDPASILFPNQNS